MSFLKSGKQWPLIVIGILGVSFTVCGITIYAAVSDASFALESDYYEKAVVWDETMEARRASEALGWIAAITVSDADQHTGKRWLSVSVTSEEGEPVAIENVHAVAFHHARRAEAREVALRQIRPGVASGELGHGADGLWQVRLRVERGGDVFLDTQDVWSEGSR
jgi:nitrogen fixation protein FixH